jgi:hypothetical protein
MSAFINIQPNIFCEVCKDCGARPVIEQRERKYFVICPGNNNHYQTRSGMIDVNEWNRFNKVTQEISSSSVNNKAS